LQTRWHHHWSNLHNGGMSISLKRGKMFRKEGCHSSVFWEAFQISRNYFSCHMHFKINLDSVDMSVRWMWRPILSHFVAQNLQWWTFQGLSTSKSSAQTPLTLFSNIFSKLSRLFQIDALTKWILCSEQSLIIHCVTLSYKRVNN